MESYEMPDSSVTASSMVDNGYKPGNGRLHFQLTSGRIGSWSAANQNDGSWFQVDFGSFAKVTIIATQGRQDAAQWVTKYRVSYSYKGLFFRDYMEGDYPEVIFSFEI